jgi:WD40 repeat protein
MGAAGALSPGGRLLVVPAGASGGVRVIETLSGSGVATLDERAGPLASVAWSLDRRRLAWPEQNGPVHVYELEPPREVAAVADFGFGQAASSVALSADGRRLAANRGERFVRLWDLATGAQTILLPGHETRGVAMSPDGRWLASSSADGFLRIWDVASVERLFAAQPAELAAEVERSTGLRLDGFDLILPGAR